jgi:hypothetical protein
MESHVLLVMERSATAEAHRRRQNGEALHYDELGRWAIRRYAGACHVPLRVTAQELGDCAHEIARRLLGKGL